jgi:hypothetical protein
MGTRPRLRAAAVTLTLGAALLLPTAPASARSDDSRGICAAVAAQFAHRGFVNPRVIAVAARANAPLIAQLTAERSAVVADLATATTERADLAARLSALQIDAATVNERIQQVQSDIAANTADLNVVGLVDRAITRELGLLSTLPDSPDKAARIAAQEQARVENNARGTLLVAERNNLLAQLSSLQTQLAADVAAEAVATNALATLDAEIASRTARLAAIDAQLSLGGCTTV